MSQRFVNGLYLQDTGLGDAATPEWMRLGYPDKGSWKRAGGREGSATAYVPGPTLPPLPGGYNPGAGGTPPPNPATSGDPTPAAAPSDGIMSSLESAFSGIPTTYLLIGGAIVAVMLLKKR